MIASAESSRLTIAAAIKNHARLFRETPILDPTWSSDRPALMIHDGIVSG